MQFELPPTYLGDGVYAHSKNGYIHLSRNDHRSPPVILLDEPTLRALISYAVKAGLVSNPSA